ncbi:MULTISPECIES: accessory gene regulator ArgB-like protein [Lysinibacillus]|uniref:accessory gene regulator ArgB-like protein n=1 Tax=Lysinibacillus TaxID=400634 RepID=UPI001CBAFF59|nr:accessory gene regulator B family protein [Lysinibacillus sphaericus]
MRRIYRLEKTLFNVLNQEQYSFLEREKLKFGIKIILSEFNKLLLIYLAAFLLDCMFPTLITHLSFFLLRQVCLGYHFKSLFTCIGWSMVAFPVAIYYLADFYVNFSELLLNIIFCILLVSIYTLAPKGTKNQPVISNAHREHLRRKMKIRLFLLVGVYFLSPIVVKFFIFYGVFLETIMLVLQSIKGEFKDE